MMTSMDPEDQFQLDVKKRKLQMEHYHRQIDVVSRLGFDLFLDED